MVAMLSSLNAGSNALVQGASRGIGLAFTKALLDDERIGIVFATSRDPERAESLQELVKSHPERLVLLAMDLEDQASIAAAADAVGVRVDKLHLLLNVSGILHNESTGMSPEKKLEQLDAEHAHRAFAINALGPALVVRYLLPLFRHDERTIIANLSARVGSIEDNGLGGWYSYRATKAAQNMFTRTMAIELGRRTRNTICVAIHPGTVATELSAPFRGGMPADRILSPPESAAHLFSVLDGLELEQSGEFFAWDGAPIPW